MNPTPEPTWAKYKAREEYKSGVRKGFGSDPAGSVIPRRPWVLSKQYLMTFVLSHENEIILGNAACQYLGDDVLRHIIAAVNAYSPTTVTKVQCSSLPVEFTVDPDHQQYK